MPTQDSSLAKACSEAMHTNDDASKMLGMEILESIPGRATLSMRVRQDMTNGHDICHGGLIFTLADSAFAHACNNANKNTVAQGCSIEFLAPGKLGDTLTAKAEERSRGSRSGVYDVEVSDQHGKLIALFRGKSYQIKGQIIPDHGDSA